ncbi:MAG: hypothetical protein V7720_18665, partial [Halioglobus sp.]
MNDQGSTYQSQEYVVRGPASLLNEYQISTINHVWYCAVYLLSISVIYWAKSKSIKQSAHGLLILLGFAYSVVVSAYT